MPYTKQDDRKRVRYYCPQNESNMIVVDKILTAGDLQYAMAVMFKSYMERNGMRYQTCNDIMGALSGAQMEFYRRHVAKYEDQKIKENGDV